MQRLNKEKGSLKDLQAVTQGCGHIQDISRFLLTPTPKLFPHSASSVSLYLEVGPGLRTPFSSEVTEVTQVKLKSMKDGEGKLRGWIHLSLRYFMV